GAFAGVAPHQGYRGIKVQGLAYVLEVVVVTAEVVVGDDEGGALLFEPVDGVPGVLEAAGVDQDDRAERSGEEPVPEEPEAFLARSAEQIEHRGRVHGDAAEVEGHGGGVFVLDPA